MSRIVALLLLWLFAGPSAAGAGSHPAIAASFNDVLVDADARGEGLLVGIPVPPTAPSDSMYWDLSGQDVSVETWTRHYRTLAGYSTPDPDKQDQRVMRDFGAAGAAIVVHEPNADLAMERTGPGDGFVVELSTPVSGFGAVDGFLYTNEGSLVHTPLQEHVASRPSADPRYHHAESDEANFEHTTSASHGWLRVEGDFTLVFIYGTFEVHNESGPHRIEAHREHRAGTPPAYEEYSITRAFVHVTNGSAFVQPGGRPLQVNLASYDILSSSEIRLLNATGTFSAGGDSIPFHDAALRVAGDGLRLTSQPFLSGGSILQRGRVEGPIGEVHIDGRSVAVGPSQAVMTEPQGASQEVTLAVLAGALLAAVTVAFALRRFRRRRQAGPLAEQAGLLLDDGDYPGAAQWAKEAIRRDPQHGDAAAVLAIACLKMGAPDEAVAHLERTRAQDDPLIQLMLCVSLREAGHPEQAQRMLRALLREHPELADLVAGTDLGQVGGSLADRPAPMPGYG